MSNYGRANTEIAWYQDDYPGAVMNPNCGVIHTTEGTSLPGYQGGATAPNYTAVPRFKTQKLSWFAHFPDERSSRALQNLPGGVETNTVNVIQVELVGTCDPTTHRVWTKVGRRHIYWPEAPDWALKDFALFVIDMQKRHGIPIEGATRWVAYPESYGSDGQRFSPQQWRAFEGWCGHQHVPENSHGDPGAFPWAKVVRFAQDLQKPDRRTPNWDAIVEAAMRAEAANRGARKATAQKIIDLAKPYSAKH